MAILSPHLDDAVLSCWHLLDGPADVRVINAFAGVPQRGAAAGWWDQLSGRHDSRAAVRDRVVEDQAALALAGREPVNLRFLDRQYRRRDQALQPLIRAVRAVVPPSAVVLAPAGLPPHYYDPVAAAVIDEPHPDHLAVRSAGLALRSEGFEVVLYADLPHASSRGLPAWILDGGSRAATDPEAARWREGLAAGGVRAHGLVSDVHCLTRSEFARKLEAVRRYATQVAVLERGLGKRLDDPAVLGYEVVWRIPAIGDDQ